MCSHNAYVIMIFVLTILYNYVYTCRIVTYKPHRCQVAAILQLPPACGSLLLLTCSIVLLSVLVAIHLKQPQLPSDCCRLLAACLIVLLLSVEQLASNLRYGFNTSLGGHGQTLKKQRVWGQLHTKSIITAKIMQQRHLLNQPTLAFDRGCSIYIIQRCFGAAIHSSWQLRALEVHINGRAQPPLRS